MAHYKFPKSQNSVVLVCDHSSWSVCAYKIISSYFEKTMMISYKRDDPFPADLANWNGDWIISFKSDLILPQEILNNARLGALNFHTSLPKYRGIGGYVLAFRNLDAEYGVTCHFMDHLIDHGKIIKILKFPIERFDTPDSIYQKTAFYSIQLLLEILDLILKDKNLPISDSIWNKQLYLYKDVKEYLDKIVD